jgi:hypothetical protein
MHPNQICNRILFVHCMGVDTEAQIHIFLVSESHDQTIGGGGSVEV